MIPPQWTVVSRLLLVTADGRRAIQELIDWHRRHYRSVASKRPLFPSRHNSGTVALHRQTAHEILKTAFIEAGLNGHIATHSLRKSFAQRLYEQTGDVFAVQEMLGHKSIATTQEYLGVNYANVRAALQKMSLDSELHERLILGTSLKNTPDETLFLELALRGYDLSRLRDDEATGGVVKIG